MMFLSSLSLSLACAEAARIFAEKDVDGDDDDAPMAARAIPGERRRRADEIVLHFWGENFRVCCGDDSVTFFSRVSEVLSQRAIGAGRKRCIWRHRLGDRIVGGL